MRLRDRTVALMRHGYHFSGWLREQDQGGDRSAIPIRLLGSRSLVVRGLEGIELFYDSSRTERRMATPLAVAHTLFGKGAIHSLDGEEHRRRKELFLQVTAPERVATLTELVREKWHAELARWVRAGNAAVFPSAVSVFGEAAQQWAGVEDAPAIMAARSRELATIVDGFGTASTAWVRARRARRRADGWATELIDDVRSGFRQPEAGTAAEVMANATDLDGRPLPAAVAAVELLNVLRPTIAVAYFAAFAALELEANPDLADACASGDDDAVEEFCHEVRRMSPFVPILAARSRCPFTWRGNEVRAGDRLLLDVYGTDHDPAVWVDAMTFDPGRFRDGAAAARPEFIPQGGGPVDTGHRCPGEGVAMALLRVVVPSMARLDWSLHPDDRTASLRRMPARPDGGVRLLDVRHHHLKEVG